jgi:hypothetical protein
MCSDEAGNSGATAIITSRVLSALVCVYGDRLRMFCVCHTLVSKDCPEKRSSMIYLIPIFFRYPHKKSNLPNLILQLYDMAKFHAALPAIPTIA